MKVCTTICMISVIFERQHVLINAFYVVFVIGTTKISFQGRIVQREKDLQTNEYN